MSDGGPTPNWKVTNVFSGVPVSDFQRSLEWYTRLFNAPPSFFPNDHEAVWKLGARQWLYIIVDRKRAGGAVQTILCDGLDEILADILARGLDYGGEERPAEGTRKVMFYDPDGNEIGIGTAPAA